MIQDRLSEEEKNAIYGSLIALSLATLFSVSLYLGLDQRAEVNQAFDRLESVEQDVSDGSLDNYTQPEAWLIIKSSNQTLSLYGPTSALFLAVSAVSFIVLAWYMYNWLYLPSRADTDTEEEGKSLIERTKQAW